MSKAKRFDVPTDACFEGRAKVSLQAAPAEGEPAPSPTFEINAYNGGIMRPYYPYLDAPLVLDIAGIRASSQEIAALLDHDDRQIVGQSTSVKISAGSVDIEGIITGDITDKTDPAGKVVLHSKNGFKWKASAGGRIEKMEYVEAGATVKVNGREFAGPLYVARSTVLNEVSLLSIAADQTTAARIAARNAIAGNGGGNPAAMAAGEASGFHAWVRAAGWNPVTLSGSQREALWVAFTARRERRA